MRGFMLGLAISVAFIIGCAASQFIVPPVRAGTNPTKWEYLCTDGKGGIRHEATDTANKIGSEGWELTTTAAGGGYFFHFCFKRPLP